MNVLFVTDTPRPNGNDLWRGLWPAANLQQHGHGAAVWSVAPNAEPPMANINVIVCCQRAENRLGATAHLREWCEAHRILLVADVTDDPYPDDSPLWQRKRRINNTTIEDLVFDHLRNVHLITVNTPTMKVRLRGLHTNIEVIEDQYYPPQWTIEREPHNGVVIGVAGGDTHANDWRVLIDPWKRIAKEYPQTRFAIIGAQYDYLLDCVPTSRTIVVPWRDVLSYQKSYATLDIGCAPLAETIWNASKSPIKWVEYGLAGAAPVVSRTVYSRYCQHAIDALVVNTSEQWYRALSILVNNPGFRARIATNARKHAAERFALTALSADERVAIYQRYRNQIFGELDGSRIPNAVPDPA